MPSGEALSAIHIWLTLHEAHDIVSRLLLALLDHSDGLHVVNRKHSATPLLRHGGGVNLSELRLCIGQAPYAVRYDIGVPDICLIYLSAPQALELVQVLSAQIANVPTTLGVGHRYAVFPIYVMDTQNQDFTLFLSVRNQNRGGQENDDLLYPYEHEVEDR